MINPIALIFSNLIPNVFLWIALLSTNNVGLWIFFIASNIIVYLVLLFIGIPTIILLMRFNIYNIKTMLLVGSVIGGGVLLFVLMAFGFLLQSGASVDFQYFSVESLYGMVVSLTYYLIDKTSVKWKNLNIDTTSFNSSGANK